MNEQKEIELEQYKIFIESTEKIVIEESIKIIYI